MAKIHIGKFDGMYINYPSNKHDEWSEEENGWSQRTRYVENSTINSGNGKSLTLFSQMQSALFTDFGMYLADI